MTPTEQDKELREQLIGISEASKPTWTAGTAHFSVSKEGLAAGFNINDLVQFITADRKRVALEARIDENDEWRLFSKDVQRGILPTDFKARIITLKNPYQIS